MKTRCYKIRCDERICNPIKEKKDTRPVKCYICKKKMYYSEHSKFEPELTVYDDNRETLYIHKRCLANKIKKVPKR